MHLISNDSLILLVLIILLVLWLLYHKPLDAIDASHFTVEQSKEYPEEEIPDPSDIPPENAYVPFETPPDPRYVYFSPRHTYLLPCNFLDFSKPFDRWMYYYYPEYYANCYQTYWPFRYPWRYDERAQLNSLKQMPYKLPTTHIPGSRFATPAKSTYMIDTKTYPTKESGFAGGWGSQKFVNGAAPISGLTSGRAMGGFGGGVHAYGGMMTSGYSHYKPGTKEWFEPIEDTELVQPAQRENPDLAVRYQGHWDNIIEGTFIPFGMSNIGAMPGELIVQKGLRSKEEPKVPYHTYNYRPTDQYVNDDHVNNSANNKEPNANSPITSMHELFCPIFSME